MPTKSITQLSCLMTAAWLARTPSIASAQDQTSPEAEPPLRLKLPEGNPDSGSLPSELRAPEVVPPVLPEDVAAQVSELVARIGELEQTGLTAETREAQDAALHEAITLAEQVLAIRIEHQGNLPAADGRPEVIRWRDAEGEPSKWYEVIDARLKAEHLRLVRRLDGAARAELATLDGMDVQHERLYREGQVAEAKVIVNRQLEIRRRLFPGDHPHVASSLNNLAFCLDSLGRAVEAEPLYEEALAMHQRLFPGDHPMLALSLNNLAMVRLDLGRVGETEPLLEQALAMYQRLFPGDHPDVAQSLNNLALVRESLGRAVEAEALYEQALAMSQRLFPGDHPDVAVSLNNLAGVRLEMGRAGRAEPLYEQSLAMSQRLFPGDHPDVAQSLNNLALVRLELGRVGEAEPLFEQALSMYKRLFPGDHPDVASGLNNLAAVRQALGRAGEAEPLYEQSLAMSQRLFPGDHPDVAQSLNNLALVRESLGRAVEAEPLLEQALAMAQRLFPGDHADVAAGLYNLAGLRQLLGRAVEAEPLYQQALAMYQRLCPGDHPEVARCMNSFAALLLASGRGGQAEPLYEQALAIRQRLFPGDHPDVATGLHNLAVVRLALGRAEEAEPLLGEALAMAERMRTEVRGSVEERAQFAGKLRLPGIAAGYARTLAELGRGAEALGVLERGRGRAGLDLLAGGRSAAESALQSTADAEALARYDAALAAEEETRLALVEAEIRLSKAPDDGKAEWAGKVNAARATLSEKTASVFNELRGLVSVVDPLTTEQMLAALRPGEALLTWSWTDDGVVALVAREGQVTGITLAKAKDETTVLNEAMDALRARVAQRPAGAEPVPDAVLSAARAAAVPEAIRELLAGASSVIAVVDGPLSGIPIELLLPDVPVAYAPTATIALRPRLDGQRETTVASTAGVIVGDPVFAGFEHEEPDYPETGILIALVTEGSNAAAAGLTRGDVLLTYGEHALASAADLGPAIAATAEAMTTRGVSDERPVTARVWRQGDDGQGEEIKVSLALGRLGVQLDQRPPADGLRSMATLDRPADALAANATALEQIRFYGEGLAPLPSTRLEAAAIATMLGSDATLLLGSEATAPRLRGAVEAAPPRVIHLATHGLLGTSDRPLLASIALSTPEEPTGEDNGFVTLGDILSTWGGQLRDTELVALSACDTASAVRQGDTMMALPLGLLIAGADTVVASLWKVDDRATALLMARFYSNWLGKAASQREVDGLTYSPGEPMPKLASLREAQQWLRHLTREQVEAMTGSPDAVNQSATRDPTPRRGQLVITPDPSARPYEHPFYWSAFVLYGHTG